MGKGIDENTFGISERNAKPYTVFVENIKVIILENLFSFGFVWGYFL